MQTEEEPNDMQAGDLVDDYLDEPAGERGPPSPFESLRLPLLVAVFGIGLLLFLAIEPQRHWILLLLTALIVLGADGILRTHPQAAFEADTAWTAPLLFLPALLTLSAGLFLEDALGGYWLVLGVLLAAVLMGGVLYAEYISVDPLDRRYTTARFILNLGTFLTAFAFYAVVYSFEVPLVAAALSVGLVSTILSVEVLRESEADPVRALVYAAVVGIIVAQARWVLYFLPLESYLAGVFLLLVFYLTSGLVQHHLNNDLRAPVITEFAVITLFGTVIVILGRLFES